MLGLLLRGALAGAALFGALVAVLGGASPLLALLFWGLGVLATLVSQALSARRGRRFVERRTR